MKGKMYKKIKEILQKTCREILKPLNMPLVETYHLVPGLIEFDKWYSEEFGTESLYSINRPQHQKLEIILNDHKIETEGESK